MHLAEITTEHLDAAREHSKWAYEVLNIGGEPPLSVSWHRRDRSKSLPVGHTDDPRDIYTLITGHYKAVSDVVPFSMPNVYMIVPL